MKHEEFNYDGVICCKNCGAVKPRIGWNSDCRPIIKCTRCGIQSNQVGFPECYSKEYGWVVSHDMQIVN
jgi:hypothetical protein